MRGLVALIFGLVVGAAAALGLLYVNPLTGERPASVNANTVLHYEFPGQSSLALTHSGKIKLSRQPAAINELWESNIANTMLGMLVLSNERSEPVALATRISKLSGRSNLLTNGIVEADYWLITFPADGTIYLESDSNIWPLVRKTLVDAELLRRPWAGPASFQPTIGPALDGTSTLVGASGDRRNEFGSGTETYTVETYDRDADSAGPIRGELALRVLEADADSSADPLDE